jgi:hypothetical protein
MKTKRGYTRHAPVIDHRQILSLLPGRLIVQQLIEREIGTIRHSIETGHREYLALLPGLELESHRLNNELAVMSDMMKGAPLETVQKGLTERPLLAAPAERRVIDASNLSFKQFHANTPTVPFLLLRELMEHGEVDRKAFVAKYAKIRSTLKGSGLSMAIAVLDRAGIKVKRPAGKIVLVSKIEGELPAFELKSEILTQNEYLVQAFRNNPDNIVDVKVAQKDLKAASPGSIMVAISLLRRKQGLKIRTLGAGKYQLARRKAA